MKKVYVGMGTDLVHHGHINIIEKARELGEVTIGLLSDEAVSKFARVPFLSFDERKQILENIKGVHEVIAQEELDYETNLRALKPDYVVHGDDWKTGPQRHIREKVLKVIGEWGGELVEPAYTSGISSTGLRQAMKEIGNTPDIRRRMLRRMLDNNHLVKVMETHNGISGLIVEDTKVELDGEVREFDAMWLSSLTDSTAKGKPDTEYVDRTSRFATINDILDVTTKPMILDGDTGGVAEHFAMLVRNIERLGLSAVVIEDKVGLKRNSLFGTEVEQTLDTIEGFCEKIQAGKKAQVTDEFMIFSRLESLIADKGMEDALTRAKAYIEAGTDGIMIHSRHKDGKEIMEFMKEYQKFDVKVPVISVPSSYNQFTEDELKAAGFSIVIYANHLLRTAFPAMKRTAESILTHKRSKEVDGECMSIKEILTILPN
ncbi:phosphoenolpyruvate mutase [Reichenbachiella carrageenanivorans]|uniref:phosphoenolpyruvate mutase n=1 Tax=Reichenbachiella carrageenanivorans TaxID=2979869 RepID=A0ABY6CZ68_9BACT|nr:phosphoenolpyruvate mutase [Reichenbachiella carrageenanivorans]UXX78709.1 phosphoenolpyruvate mutase [Reichenbachiella carrageenanivorans]